MSPFLNGTKVDFRLSAIQLLASSCKAKASSLFCNSAFIHSSTAGYLVFSKVKGIAFGDSPNMSSNGVVCLSACRQLLWVNSIRCRVFGQSSGCDVQYIDR